MVGACQDAQDVPERTEICSTAIVTSGSPLAGFSFSNFLHFDWNDIIPGKKCRDFLTHVARRTDIDLNDMGKVRYIMRWMDRFGALSVPTTCNYEFVSDFAPEPCCIFLFFSSLP